MINFTFSLDCHTPLGTEDKFCSPDFPVDFSFIYGERDWVRSLELEFATKCVEINGKKNNGKSQFYYVPDGTHNMHFSNPEALANIIKNDLLGTSLPVRSLEEQGKNDDALKWD